MKNYVAPVLAISFIIFSLRITPARAGTSELSTLLRSRGLIAPPLSDTTGRSVAPPDSAEVDERVQTDLSTGQELARVKAWDERAGDNLIHLEVSTLPTKQHTVSYWVFPASGAECKTFGWTMYDANDRPLQSSYWRNGPELRVTGGVDFPANIFPGSIPPEVFMRVLGSNPKTGSHARLEQQISPYGLISQSVRVQDKETVAVPAGTFSAFRVNTVPEVNSLMPSWPGFVLKVVGRFVPHSTFYFDSKPPYRLLKQEGTLAAGGPQVRTELERYYIEGTKAENSVETR